MLTEYDFISGSEFRNLIPAINVSIALMPTEPAPIIPAAFLDNLYPKRASIRKLRNGTPGIRAIIVLIFLFFP
jgi:hypothetical protein